MNNSDHYRLSALVEIAWVAPDALSITEIARRRRIPPAYLSQLLRDLRREGWLRTRRGPGGGVTLARDPEQIPVAEVLGVSAPPSPSPGAIGRLEAMVAEALSAAVAGLTLADLVSWERRGVANAEYVI